MPSLGEPGQSLSDRVVDGILAAVRTHCTVVRHGYRYQYPEELATVAGPILVISPPTQIFVAQTNEADEVSDTIELNVVVPREDAERDLDRAFVDLHRALFHQRDPEAPLPGLPWLSEARMTARRTTEIEGEDTVVVVTMTLQVSYTSDTYDVTQVWGGYEL